MASHVRTRGAVQRSRFIRRAVAPRDTATKATVRSRYMRQRSAIGRSVPHDEPMQTQSHPGWLVASHVGLQSAELTEDKK